MTEHHERLRKSLEYLNATLGRKYGVQVTLEEWKEMLEEAGLNAIETLDLDRSKAYRKAGKIVVEKKALRTP